MYNRSERPLTDEERREIQAEIDLEVPDHPMFALPGARDAYTEGLRKRVRQNEAILADGQAVIHRCQAESVAVIAPMEDVSCAYFFDAGNGQLVCYHGTDPNDRLDVAADSVQWPNDHFEFVHPRVHESSHHEWLTWHGSAMRPKRHIQRTMAIWEWLPKASIEIFEGSIDTLENDLARNAGVSDANVWVWETGSLRDQFVPALRVVANPESVSEKTDYMDLLRGLYDAYTDGPNDTVDVVEGFSAAERDALLALFQELQAIASHPQALALHNDESFRNATEWQPVRDAAQAAVHTLRSSD